jgi:hypothetical protein
MVNEAQHVASVPVSYPLGAEPRNRRTERPKFCQFRRFRNLRNSRNLIVTLFSFPMYVGQGAPGQASGTRYTGGVRPGFGCALHAKSFKNFASKLKPPPPKMLRAWGPQKADAFDAKVISGLSGYQPARCRFRQVVQA